MLENNISIINFNQLLILNYKYFYVYCAYYNGYAIYRLKPHLFLASHIK